MSGRSRTRSALAAAVPALVLALAASGCGGSDDGGAAPRDSPSSTAASLTAPPPTSTTPSSSPSSSHSATPSATPSTASGVTATLATMSFRFPAGWRVSQAVSRTNTAAFDPSTARGSVIVYDQPSFGGETVDSEARLSLGTARRTGMHPTRQADITVGGVQGYVITGADRTYPVYYVFGTVNHGHDVTMIFQYTRNTPQAQPTIASVLASVVWS